MTIPTNEQLIENLTNCFRETIDWIEAQPVDAFNEEMISGKWTIAGHLYHLIKSSKATSKGLAMPKLGLRTMYGKNKRQERSYDEMVEKYRTVLVKNNVKAPQIFEAEPGRIFDRAELIKRFEGELDTFVENLQKWKPDDMSVYLMPHPAIGKCTIREFVYFTILHTYHHLDILKAQYTKQ